MNITEYINAAFAEGKTAENIAKEFTDTLNKVSTQNSRSNYLNHLESQSQIHNYRGYIAGIILCIANEHTDWDYETLKSFEKTLLKNIENNVRIIDCAMKKENIGELAFDILEEILRES